MNPAIYIALGFVLFVGFVFFLQRSKHSEQPVAGDVAKSLYGPVEIESYIREHITNIAREEFPDNPDVAWTILDISHESELVIAEVEPSPDEVGYPRFKMGFMADGNQPPKVVATYCWEDGEYTLLSTARGAPRGLPNSL